MTNSIVKILILVIAFQLGGMSKEYKISCPEEYSIGFLEKKFLWPATNESGTYLSDPVCLDWNLDIVRRECRDGYWYPNRIPFCFEDVCPQYFVPVDQYCSYTTEPGPYEMGCPSYESRFNATTNVTTYVWDDIENGQCHVTHYDEQKIVNCQSLYSHKCLYDKKALSQYTEKRLPTVDVFLSFDEIAREMYLTIYSPEGITDFKDDITCFTHHHDFEEDRSKQRVDFEEVYDFRKVDHSDYLNYRNFTVFKLDIEDKPLEYWCNIFLRESGKLLMTDKTVGHKDDVGNEFVMYARIELSKKYPKDHFEYVDKYCKKMKVSCRPFELFDFNAENFTSYFLIHVTTKYKRSVIKEYYSLKYQFRNIDYVDVVNFTSASWCLPTGGDHLSWELTEIGTKTVSKQFCITKHDMIALRKCEGNFLYGSRWEKYEDECSEDVEVSEKTKFLFNISRNEITPEVLRSLTQASYAPQNLSTMDVFFVSDILYKVSVSNQLGGVSEDFYDTVSNLFTVDNKILKNSQALMNSTDMILNALDLFLTKECDDKLNSSNNYLDTFVKANFIVHITKPFLNNISGVALYGDSNTFYDYEIVQVYKNQTLSDIDLINLQVATYLPEKLLDILVDGAGEDVKTNLSVITTIFYNDTMFNEDVGNGSVDSKVIGVIVPGFGAYLPYPIPLLLRRNGDRSNESCNYWSYGKQSQDRKGGWSRRGISYEAELNSSVILCAFSHLTHFALLIMTERSAPSDVVQSSLDIYDEQLSIITIVCSCMSLIGIIGIFLTAILYRRWREKLGTKFLIQLSITIILEIILTQIAGLDNWLYHENACTAVGILLHYVVLSKFAWMLVIAFLQYLRFVKVLGTLPPKLLLKSMIVGWVLPILPVALTVAIFPFAYSIGHNFCYPQGLALYIGLMAPVILIIAANISVFLLIMHAIYTSKAVKYDKSGKMLKRQVYLAILLFFLLGIHWIFGILAEILPDIWLQVMFVYLFCFAAGLQGFVLFMFYVLLDKDTRLLWSKSIRYRKNVILS